MSQIRPLVDFHTHAFPDAIAERTMTKLSAIAKTSPATDGTLGGLREFQAAHGVTLSVVCQIATKPSQQLTVNNWAAAHQKDGVLFFGSVHPDAPDALEELERIKEIGLHGVKLHPDYQGFLVADEKVFPLYEKIASLGLPLTLHTGRDPFSPELIHAEPKKIAEVAKAFPDLTLIGAHLGGMELCDAVEKYLVGLKNVYFDLSMTHTFASAEQVTRVIKNHGADRILFATDLPWGSAEDTLAFLESLPLAEEEKDLIRYKNAYRLLGL